MKQSGSGVSLTDCTLVQGYTNLQSQGQELPECTCIASSNGGQAQVEVLEGGPPQALAVSSILHANAHSAKTQGCLAEGNIATRKALPPNKKQPTIEMPVYVEHILVTTLTGMQ